MTSRAQWRARLRMALAYLLAAIVLGFVAASVGGLARVLWWPAAALTVVAFFYAGPGAAGFRKKNGQHPLALKLLLAPYLIGARLPPRWRDRHCWEPSPVSDGVWLGRLPLTSEMARSQFASLVDMTAELSIRPGKWQYASLPCLDVVPLSASTLMAAAWEIERLRAGSAPVLVACALGRGRSASAVAAWLLLTGRAASVDDAIAQVRRVRPQTTFRETHRQVLAECFSAQRTGREAE